jgi:CelD/BcsL family acetyltransferase involved in cellulose biosynthesis
MLLPLLRRRKYGMRLLSWFPGGHVGCNAPLIDAARFARLDEAQRAALWTNLARSLPRADILYLACVPADMAGADVALGGLGEGLAVETLYQARFASWEEANTTQRSKSRRKHDRQQGERLEALGKVEFAEIGNGEEAREVLATMFHQRARRFAEMGVADPFAPADIARFYYDMAGAGSEAAVRLHVLRLNGEIVAVRYNIALGDTLFCLISSMSDDPAIQVGSPGKQCLLRVMQTVFDAGYRNFDMGAGFTDEKRHWCNTRTPLSHHYLALTMRGRAAIALYRGWHTVRARIKADPRLLGAAKRLRATLLTISGRGARAPAEVEASE